MSLYSELEDLGRRRLSASFFMRDFLYSEIANARPLTNMPKDVDLAVKNGRVLCEDLLEPLTQAFGRVCVRSGYRSETVNEFGHAAKSMNCGSNESNYGAHIWDVPNASTGHGAMACVVIPVVADLEEKNPEIWKQLGFWIHDHLPAYKTVWFFSKLCAFNIGWSERGEKLIRRQGDSTLYNEAKGQRLSTFGPEAYPSLLPLVSPTFKSFGLNRHDSDS